MRSNSVTIFKFRSSNNFLKFYTIALLFIFISLTNINAQIPTGYYDAANGKSGDSLRIILQNIITTGHVKLSYSAVWTSYSLTDVRPTPNNTKVWDMYSDIPGGTPLYTYTVITNQCGTSTQEGDCYSREHSMPNSWWGGIDDATHQQYTDLHHLFPADQYVNGYKSAHPIGQVTNPTYTSSNGSKVGPCSYTGYTGTVFEPINEYKGDFSRAYLYIATRYRDKISSWVKSYPTTEAQYIIDTATNNFKIWFINQLLDWNNADLVSQKEIDRNNAIYYSTAQHNRNPFIDHPEYVQYIWGTQTATIKAEPSNHVTGLYSVNVSPAISTITLYWTDATGTIIPDGYLIKASTTGFSNIINPVDSVVETVSTLVKSVNAGAQTVTFSGLNPNTIYYFKIFPFTNGSSNINYKTDGLVPAIADTTAAINWKEDFETGSKTAYATASVTCTMGSWTMNDALIGTLTSDKKNGTKSVRLRTGSLFMNFDKAGGVGSITILNAKYGTDADKVWQLSMSKDGGTTWSNIGNPVTCNSSTLVATSFVINQTGNVRFKIESTSTPRMNIDDIAITDFVLTNKTLKVKCFIEGFFNGINMNPAMNDTTYQYSSDITDRITIDYRDTVPPYNVLYSDSLVYLYTNGIAYSNNLPLSFNRAAYVVIKQRNSIETWTSIPISFNNDTTNYDFTTSASKSFSDNQKQVSSNVYGIYSGDINQDGLINIYDLSYVFEAIYDPFGISGYIIEDVNGDGIVNIYDLALVFDNMNLGIGTVSPLSVK